MSVYVPAELRRQVRAHFRDSCAYCLTPEALTVVAALAEPVAHKH